MKAKDMETEMKKLKTIKEQQAFLLGCTFILDMWKEENELVPKVRK